MTAEILYGDLYEKYGDDFNWFMPSFIDRTYIQEAEKEIKEGHFLYGHHGRAPRRCGPG